ncbi:MULTISPECIES: GlsB/YeaQ/YmgE family stress response membrane protein [unclassified Schlesneria]|uniref:GlsB/YeaQ/YmgE family stress response membrane protein n=1 Tax=Schlesneria TaxID=656899 RepID=UPI002F24806E
MAEPTLVATIELLAQEALMWIGFGTIVGLSAKALMPGRDPGGAIGTMLMGIVGSLIGCSILLLFDTSFKITPISPIGFAAGTIGAFLLLFFFRLLSNSYVVEAVDGKVSGRPGTVVTTYHRRRTRKAA